jgi:type IV pilus assembly protein PilQ
MEIFVTNNELGAIINGEQSFTTKEAQTELLVDDGDTVIIGGIRKTRKDSGEKGVPGLMKIPLLGWLFKAKAKSDDMEELLIFITPRIVQLEQRGQQGR